jgi:hypothetical protein
MYQGKPLLRGFEGIKETLHPRFLTSRRVFLNDSFARGGIDFFDHLFQRGFRFRDFFFLGENHKFFDAGSYGTFYGFIPNTPFFALSVPLFRGTLFSCQRTTPFS